MSAPGLSNPRIVGPSIAAEMTQVQDHCRPASRAAVCHYLHRENHHIQDKLRMAMRDEKPPYQKRALQLRRQLRNCR
jgi:hypothetical protein